MTDNRRPVKVAKIPLPMYEEIERYQKEIEDYFEKMFGRKPTLTDSAWEWYIRNNFKRGSRR